MDLRKGCTEEGDWLYPEQVQKGLRVAYRGHSHSYCVEESRRFHGTAKPRTQAVQDREVGTIGEERRVRQPQQLSTGLGALRDHGVTRDLALVQVTEIHRLVILVAEAESSIIMNHLSPGVG